MLTFEDYPDFICVEEKYTYSTSLVETIWSMPLDRLPDMITNPCLRSMGYLKNFNTRHFTYVYVS